MACWFQVVDVIEKLREMDLVRIKQELDDLAPAVPGKPWGIKYLRMYLISIILFFLVSYTSQI